MDPMLLAALGAALFWAARKRRRRKQPRGDPLDDVLFVWPDGTPFTVRELIKSVAIFGATGSGKSSGSGLLLARAIVGLARSGGLILVSKPEDKEFWIRIFQSFNRLGDLIIFGPGELARCNFIDFLMRQGGDTRTLVEFLMVTGEALSSAGKGGESALFWEQSKKRLLFNAIEPIRQAWGEITIPKLQEFIATAQYSPELLKDETLKAKWTGQYHYRTMMEANGKKKTPIETSDFLLTASYWVDEFVYMDNKVRSSVIADVLNVLHTYNLGIVRELVSTTTTVSPADMALGKWVLVDCPVDELGESGKIVMHGWKYLTQRFILRRKANPGDSVIVIHADEAQEMVSSFDSAFLAKCRSHLGCMIYLTQSIHSYMSGGKRD